MENMESKLDQITELLKVTHKTNHPVTSKPNNQTIWNDKEKLAKIKSPPPVLIIKKSHDNEINKENE